MVRRLLPLACLLALACSSSSKEPARCAVGQNVCIPPAGGLAFCATLATDVANCGACNSACGAVTGSTSVACHAGSCAVDCGGGFASTTQIVCGAKGSADGGFTPYCTDITKDHENCGACGTVCAGTQQCASGRCTDVGSTAACSGSGATTVYKDLQNDHDNCGACGRVCGPTEVCRVGDCDPCPVAQCGGACIDTLVDPKNCGSCGTAAVACEGGTALARLVSIEPVGALALHLLAATNGTISVRVHSQLRIARVKFTTSAQGASVQSGDMFLQGPGEVSPTAWSTPILTVPAGATALSVTLDAFDEQYVAGAPDAASHTDELTGNLQVLAAPTAVATNVAVAQGTNAVGTTSGQYAWVPLNAGPLTFTATVPIGLNIAQVEFDNGTSSIIGLAPVLPNGQATLTLAPGDVGLGTIAVKACAVDALGQKVAAANCATGPTFTVGRIASNGTGSGGDPVVARNADGSHTIYYVPSTNGLWWQDAQQLNTNQSAQPGQQVGTDTFLPLSLRPTPEGSGVYVIKSDGLAVERIDGPTAVNATFVQAPGGQTFARFERITPAAMMLFDPNNFVLLASAVSKQPSQAALSMGTQGGTLYSSLAPTSGGTKSGAIVGWFTTGGNTLPWIFHPSLLGNHSFPLMPAVANAFAVDLQVFPDGEIAFAYAVQTNPGSTAAATYTMYFGAAKFDGTNPPVLLAPFQVGQVNGGPRNLNFIVAKPGVLLGSVPALLDTTGSFYEPLEVNLNGTPAKFSPWPYDGAGKGGLVQNGVATRVNSVRAQEADAGVVFAVDDNQNKALFATFEGDADGGVEHLHLLDLASATQTVVNPAGSTQMATNTFGAPPPLPRFVHSAQVYTGGAVPAASQTMVWSEVLPRSNTVSARQRLSFASYQGGAPAATVIDRPVPLSPTALPQVESAAGAVILFLADADVGGTDLYSVPLGTPAGPTTTPTRIADRVFSFRVREDKARLLVARTDGALLYAPLTPGANLAQTLVPIAVGGPSGDPMSVSGQNAFGFTPDGDHAYVVRDQITDRSGNARGLLVTIDLNTGVRTNYGRIINSTSGAQRPASFNAGFLANAATAIIEDTISVESNATRLTTALAASGTLHKDTGLLPSTVVQPITFSASLDGTEGLALFNSSRFAAPTFAVAGGSGAIFEKDGSFVPLWWYPTDLYTQPATISPFGGPYRPEFGFLWGGGGTYFKVWGGAQPLPPVTLNPTGFADALGSTVQTPDHKELLLSYTAGGSYTMVLPLNGKAPPAPVVP